MHYYFSNYPVSVDQSIIEYGLFFVVDKWNDFGYFTRFHAFLIKNQEKFELGFVNIGVKSKNISNTFNYLSKIECSEKVLSSFPKEVFMLGSLSYYSELQKRISLKPQKETLFKETNDIAFNVKLFKSVKDIEVVKTSFFRDLVSTQIENKYNQLNRVAHGGPKFKNFDWDIRYLDSNIKINISNNRNSLLPTNTFAFIGNNGVGKTSLLKDVVSAAASDGFVPSAFFPGDKVQLINNESHHEDTMNSIVSLVFVSFSAFDVFDDQFKKAFEDNQETFKFVGNRIVRASEGLESYNSIMSSKDFGYTVEADLEWNFVDPEKEKLLMKVMKNFEWDKELNDFVREDEKVYDTTDNRGIRKKLQEKTELLSSGQKVILSVIGNLIRYASENSVFLIDEPELYLHPPYILALILSINEIAEKTNSICVIVTHSAITLQEIPSSNVFIIQGSQDVKKVSHPKIETFGANTQTINDNVFGLDIRSTGYYKFLKNIADNEPEKVDDLIKSGKLGSDALLYLDILRDDNNV